MGSPTLGEEFALTIDTPLTDAYIFSWFLVRNGCRHHLSVNT
jgi:hypothetical protein